MIVAPPFCVKMSLLYIYLSITCLVCSVECVFCVYLSLIVLESLAISFIVSQICVLESIHIRCYLIVAIQHLKPAFIVHTSKLICLILWRLVMHLILRKWRLCVDSNNFFNSLLRWQSLYFVKDLPLLFKRFLNQSGFQNSQFQYLLLSKLSLFYEIIATPILH